MKYVEAATVADALAIELALWVRFASETRSLYQSWQSLPDEQVPLWYVQAGRPAPPEDHEGLDFNVGQGRWVWHTGAAPGVDSLQVATGGALVRMPLATDTTDLVSVVDWGDIRVSGAANDSELYGAATPRARARLALGLPVGGEQIERAQAVDLSSVSTKSRAQLAPRFRARLDEEIGLQNLPARALSR